MKVKLKEDMIIKYSKNGINIQELDTVKSDRPNTVNFADLRYTKETGLVRLQDLEEFHCRHLGNNIFELHCVPLEGTQKIKMQYKHRKRLCIKDGKIQLLSKQQQDSKNKQQQDKMLKFREVLQDFRQDKSEIKQSILTGNKQDVQDSITDVLEQHVLQEQRFKQAAKQTNKQEISTTDVLSAKIRGLEQILEKICLIISKQRN